MDSIAEGDDPEDPVNPVRHKILKMNPFPVFGIPQTARMASTGFIRLTFRAG